MTPIVKNNISLTSPVVLIAPLDWGLGHTTRCIPVISSLLLLGCQVIAAVDAKQQALLEQEFNTIRFVRLKGYQLEYGKTSLHTIIKIVIQIPKIVKAIFYEKKWLNKFIQSNHIHAVISDNRYGFFNKELPCVFITHQLVIQSPFGKTVQKIIQFINYQLIKNFSACWVPDYKGDNNLAGELSHPEKMPPLQVTYLGRLSRLGNRMDTAPTGTLLILLSGPEPQRSIFEEIIRKELETFPGTAVLVRGLPKETRKIPFSNKNVTVYNYLSSVQLEALIARSEFIVSRSGYSTIMDIAGCNKKCIFVPTPGQSEQIYLAEYLQKKRLCISFYQKNFSLVKALQKARKFSFASMEALPSDVYKKELEDFVLKLTSSSHDAKH